MGPPINVDTETQVGAPTGVPRSNGAGEQRTGISEIPIEFEAAFRIAKDCRYFLSNRTPYLIHIAHPDQRFGELLLPPLAERVMTGARLQPFEELLLRHRQRHEVLLRRYVETISLVDTLFWIAWLSLMLIGGIAVYDLLQFGTLVRPEIGIASVVGVIVLAVVLLRGTRREFNRKRTASADGTEVGDIAYGIGGSYSDGNETARSARQLLTLTIVLTVGAVLPAIAILVGTDANDFLIMNGGLRVKSGLESRMVARVIQIIYTCLLSLFPALLFFQFDRLQAGSIRTTWIRALFRMDGRMQTVADIDATYGHAMYEASNNSEDSVRGLGGKNSPIVIATILIALGWTVLVIRTESFDFSGTTSAAQSQLIATQQADIARTAAEDAAKASTEDEAKSAAAVAEEAATAAASAQEATGEIADTSTQIETARAPAPAAPSGQPNPETLDQAQAAAEVASTAAARAAQTATANSQALQATPYFQLLAPSPSAAGMAFLGAYFFGIYLVLRSYFRGDLRARIYNQITARLVTVVVLAYLINAILFPNTDREEIIWTLAFLAGVVPTTVLDRIMHTMGGLVKSVAGDTFAADRPLEHIDGIDIYDASRLEAEGIPDVAALASGDLASLMLQTRLPIGRLVDWADQAALLVVVGMPGSQLDPRVLSLRQRGIRTGTDLLAIAESDGNVDEIADCLDISRNDRRPGLIGTLTGDGDHSDAGTGDSAVSTEQSHDHEATDPTLQVHDGKQVNIGELCRAIRRQPVMTQVLQWRSSSLDDPDRSWVLLTEGRSEPTVSPCYVGPLPSPGVRHSPTSTHL